ncbi:amidohydrolase family protein [Methanothermobacter tenebrarum]|uniref:5'-deoxyadenosine deaminase n=1 Tax=Methanothermobacter tenebrarum TaxID=680118 RepID=A0A328P8Y8_9EURY|nr:amidohydrolase family protein [Methanothermobacter tenebrarum]MBC7117890.1 amidohydrolase family protein [Methanobacteriaceae archaeon]NPV65347.1 amidohydrolase family protein [Methanobacteriaceae archaeon]RAO78947.1 N-ethylammeline chlorohydrolase [Methanothermobacter tenebrarum]
METENILIKDAQILDAHGQRKGSVLIENDKIKEISPSISPEGVNKVINAEGKLLIPGFVNTHTHLSMTLFRGIADDLKLEKWLNDYIWPLEAHLNGEYCYAGALLGCVEMIKSGTTTFNDMYFYMDHVAEAVKESGLRAVISHGMIDFGDEKKRKAEIKESKRIIRKCHGMADGRIKVALGPHSPYTCSRQLLDEVRSLADKYGLLIHIHVAETEDEVRQVKDKYGERPFIYLDEIGFLGEDVIAAHAVWLSSSEIHILRSRGVKLSHNPASNMKLASGVSPVEELINMGVCVSLGTDGAASNNNLDMLEEMKIAALLQKIKKMDPTALDAGTVFKMATINGAAALGMADEIGTIEVDKKADLALINTRRSSITPWRNPTSHLVYAASGCDVESVICNGEILMENDKLESLDEKYVIELAENAAEELISKA